MSADRYAQLAEQHLSVVLKSGREWMCRCPHHEDRSPSLQFNVEKGLWVCFSCGRKGNARSLFGREAENTDENIEMLLSRIEMIEKADKTPPTRSVALAESILRRYNFPTDYWTVERGFTEETVKAFQLGFDPIAGTPVIPVRDVNGDLLGVIRRMLNNTKYGPKYMYPKGFPRGESLFASWLVAKMDTNHVVLTEGSADAMSVWEAGYPALAIYGSSITQHQGRLLRRLGIDSVTLFFDNDDAGRHVVHTSTGAYDPACTKCQVILEGRYRETPPLTGIQTYVVTYKGSDPKDPGAMTANRICRRVDAAERFL